MMPGSRHRPLRHLGALCLLALLACPIALSGHMHAPGDIGASRASCAVCAATAHAPAITAVTRPHFALVRQGAPSLQPVLTPPPVAETLTRGPRAPPTSFVTLAA
jgi:hypothetical protein